jgi:hypothetical protein
MKERIEAVQFVPFLDRLTVRVFRQLNRFHVPTSREYSARYSDEAKVRALAYNFIVLNEMVALRTIDERLERWNYELKR